MYKLMFCMLVLNESRLVKSTTAACKLYRTFAEYRKDRYYFRSTIVFSAVEVC